MNPQLRKILTDVVEKVVFKCFHRLVKPQFKPLDLLPKSVYAGISKINGLHIIKIHLQLQIKVVTPIN